GNFEVVATALGRLRQLEPEHAAEIDQTLAAAYYNAGVAVEQAGDLNRARYLFQQAQLTNPNLGEAAAGLARVESALPGPATVVPVLAQASQWEGKFITNRDGTAWVVVGGTRHRLQLSLVGDEDLAQLPEGDAYVTADQLAAALGSPAPEAQVPAPANPTQA